MYNAFQFEVNGQRITRIDKIIPVAKCRNLFYAHFDFKTEEWEGIKTALFVQGKYSKSQIIGDDNNCLIPWEFFDTDKDTYGYVSVFCGDLVTSNAVQILIKKSGYQCSDSSNPPTPSVYQRILDIIFKKGDMIKIDEKSLLLLANGEEISRVDINIEDGREIELHNNGVSLQWHYVGESDWKNLVDLSELKGDNGITPNIGENGNWYLGEEDTGKPSRGLNGKDGDIPNIQIGEVATLEPGSEATVMITGTAENPLLNIGIPKGEKGEDAEEKYSAPIKVSHGTADTTFTLPPNVEHAWDEVLELTLTLQEGEEGKANIHCVSFISGATPTHLEFSPKATLTKDIEPNGKYTVIVFNGIAAVGRSEL